MNFQQNHALCVCFGRKPEYEQAFIFFQQNFSTPLPCSSSLEGCVLHFLVIFFGAGFWSMWVTAPCGAGGCGAVSPVRQVSVGQCSLWGRGVWGCVPCPLVTGVCVPPRPGGSVAVPPILSQHHRHFGVFCAAPGTALCLWQRGIYGMQVYSSICHSFQEAKSAWIL